jgi:hypothetical protein
MKIQEDLREFVKLLNSHDVKYVIVGGYAVAYHGYPRYTGDIDFFIEASPANASKLIAAITEFGFAGLGLTEQDFLEPETIVQLGQPPNRIDLVTTLSGVEFDQAWQHRLICYVDGLSLTFIDKQTLMLNKAAAGRPKDLADLDALS